MTLAPDALLAGPRGRRLCLEHARAAAQALGTPAGDAVATALMWAAYDLDPDRAPARDASGPGSDARPTATAGDVARALGTLPLGSAGPRALLGSLAAAVDSARYWQAPDGADVLAASPGMARALTRVAVHVTRAPGATWWSAPLDAAAQRSVRFPGTAPPGAAGATATQRLADWHTATVQEETTARAERPRDPRAPLSGVWWSTPPAELTRTSRDLGAWGPVGLWLVEDSAGPDCAEVRHVRVPTHARVLEVDGPGAWARLCRRHPLTVTASRRHDWYRATGREGPWRVPDWRAVARDVDAVHLTVAGYLTTAGRAVDLGDGASSVLAGWDPDVTYWLGDLPEDEPTAQVWVRDDAGWRRSG